MGFETLVIFPSHTYGLPTDERTLPQALKDAGYDPAMVGKWRPGHADQKYWPQIAGSTTSMATLFRGAVRKGNWKRVKIALLPGKPELFDLSRDPGEKQNVADQFPISLPIWRARLVCSEVKPSEWIKAQPGFLGAQGKTVFDPDFDIDNSGLPHEKLPCRPIRQRVRAQRRPLTSA